MLTSHFDRVKSMANSSGVRRVVRPIGLPLSICTNRLDLRCIRTLRSFVGSSGTRVLFVTSRINRTSLSACSFLAPQHATLISALHACSTLCLWYLRNSLSASVVDSMSTTVDEASPPPENRPPLLVDIVC